MPPFLRALVLVGLLTGAGIIAYRYLLTPMASRLDDLSLALRVDHHRAFFSRHDRPDLPARDVLPTEGRQQRTDAGIIRWRKTACQ